MSSTWCPVPAVQYLMSSTCCPGPDVQYLLSSTCCPVPDVQYLLSSTWCPVPAVQYLMSSTWCPVSAVQYRCVKLPTLPAVLCSFSGISQQRFLSSGIFYKWFMIYYTRTQYIMLTLQFLLLCIGENNIHGTQIHCHIIYYIFWLSPSLRWNQMWRWCWPWYVGGEIMGLSFVVQV